MTRARRAAVWAATVRDGPVANGEELVFSTVQPLAPVGPRCRRRGPSLWASLAGAFAALRRWRRMRRALADLRALDDRLLEDIGLYRSTLYASARARHGFGRRDGYRPPVR